MAHIDAQIDDKALDSFFTQTKGAPNTEISILSGEKKTATAIIKAVDRAKNTKVVFACANFDRSRSDSATVDKEGKIYYGTHPKLLQASINNSEWNLAHFRGTGLIKGLRIINN